MQKIFDASAEALTSGVLPGVTNEEALMFLELNNVVIEAKGLGRPLGADLIESVAEDVSHIVTLTSTAGTPSVNRAFISGDTGIWMYDGTDIVSFGFPFTTGGRPLLETWGNWCLATNAKDHPKVWKNTGTSFVDLGGLSTGFTWCKQLIRRQPYVLALGTNESPVKVRWCSASDVETWSPLASNSAGDFDIRDIAGEIRGGCALGDAIGIYSDEAVTVASYIGLPYVFSFVTTLHGFGIYGPKSVCAVGRQNYGIGPQGIFQTDGYSFELLGDDNFRKWLKNNVDDSTEIKKHEITTLHNEFTDSVEFFFPKKGGGYCALYWKLGQQKFTMGDLRCNAAVEREVFSTPLVAVGKDVCRLTRDVQTWAGTRFLSTIRTKWLDCGEVAVDKFVDHVFLNGELNNVDIEVFMEDMAGMPRRVYRKQNVARQNFILQEAQKIQVVLYCDDDFHLSHIRFYGEIGAMAL